MKKTDRSLGYILGLVCEEHGKTLCCECRYGTKGEQNIRELGEFDAVSEMKNSKVGQRLIDGFNMLGKEI